MTHDYLVAEHLFRVDIPDGQEFGLDNYAPFAVKPQGEPLFTLEVAAGKAPEPADLELVIDQGEEPGETVLSLWRRGGGRGWLVKMAPSPGRPTSGLLTLSADFKQSTLYVIRPQEADFALNNSLMLQFAFATATLGTLEMHASTVVNDGKAYLFLAKSGTGKSTHSKMWLRAVPGTHLMNDDNPVVRTFPDGRVIAYGSPWSGKTPCYRNESFPVGAFVRIVRAPENRLERLSIVESYASVYSSCSGFKADRAMGDGLHLAISAAIQGAPSFAMHCLPDEDAARVCFEGIAGEGAHS